MMLTVEPPDVRATAIEVAEPHVSLPTGTLEKANENVVVEPLRKVNSAGGSLARGQLNWIGLLAVGRSTLADGRTDPVRSWRVSVGQPLMVHGPEVI